MNFACRFYFWTLNVEAPQHSVLSHLLYSLHFICLENLTHAHSFNDLLQIDVSQIYLFSLITPLTPNPHTRLLRGHYFLDVSKDHKAHTCNKIIKLFSILGLLVFSSLGNGPSSIWLIQGRCKPEDWRSSSLKLLSFLPRCPIHWGLSASHPESLGNLTTSLHSPAVYVLFLCYSHDIMFPPVMAPSHGW